MLRKLHHLSIFHLCYIKVPYVYVTISRMMIIKCKCQLSLQCYLLLYYFNSYFLLFFLLLTIFFLLKIQAIIMWKLLGNLYILILFLFFQLKLLISSNIPVKGLCGTIPSNLLIVFIASIYHVHDKEATFGTLD